MEYHGHVLRNELKYLINDLEYTSLKSKLKTIMKLDKNTGDEGEYHVRSLYFDDLMNTAYDEKEGGVFHRKKYRIRIYNKDEGFISLEKKEKFGKYVSKTSRSISKDLYYNILKKTHNFNEFKDDSFLLEFYLETKMKGLEPVVIVDYIREPYVYKYGNVRITFDKNLQTLINTNDIFERLPLYASPFLDGAIILEIKYDEYLPELIRRELKMSHHQLLAVSKYTICRDFKNSIYWKERIL